MMKSLLFFSFFSMITAQIKSQNSTIESVMANKTLSATNISGTLTITNTCWVALNRFDTVPPELTFYLFLSLLILGIVNITTNILVIHGIKTTKQYENQSTRLILILSIYDVIRTCVTNSFVLLFVMWQEHFSCSVKKIMAFFSYFWIYSTAYLYTVIALDRYLRIKAAHNYLVVFSCSRYWKSVIFSLGVSLLQALFICLGPSILKLQFLAFLLIPNNLIMMLLTITFYIASIRLLRSISEQNRISTDSRRYTTMASIYLVIYFSFYFPVILSQIFSGFLFSDSDIFVSGMIILYIYITPDAMGILNSSIFMIKNRRCCQHYKITINSFQRRMTGLFFDDIKITIPGKRSSPDFSFVNPSFSSSLSSSSSQQS